MVRLLFLLLLLLTSCINEYTSWRIELQPVNTNGILIEEETNKWKKLPYEIGDTIAYKYSSGIISKFEFPSLYKSYPKFIVKKIEKKW